MVKRNLMNIKKGIAIVLAASIMLLSGCGNGGSGKTNGPTAGPAPATTAGASKESFAPEALYETDGEYSAAAEEASGRKGAGAKPTFDVPGADCFPDVKEDSGADETIESEETGDEPRIPDTTEIDIDEPDTRNENAEAFLLTAGEWKDNDNWPFFRNLISGGRIEFPVFGMDPRNRIKVVLQDGAGNVLSHETVSLVSEEGRTIFEAVTDKEGKAYLFFEDGVVPKEIQTAGGVTPIEFEVVEVDEESPNGECGQTVSVPDEVIVTGNKTAGETNGTQVMFIVDTTGSMGDELSYLQKDFAKIAEETGGNGVTYSVNFYRDKGDAYVTKRNAFSSDISEVKSLINAETATGGGDEPEAVAQILDETITQNSQWDENSEKVAFLIFDAPPHEGTEDTLIAAVRSAAKRGIHLVPVVASNTNRQTELFARALAIYTNGDYVFLTDDSGIGGEHLEPIIGDFEVESLHDIIVRIINSYK